MNPTPTLTPRPSFWSAALIVAKREIRARFLSKSFIISTLITLAVVLVMIVVMPRMGDLFAGSGDTVAVTPDTAAQVAQLGDELSTMEVADEAAARAAVQSEEADAAVIPNPDNPVGLTIVAIEEPPSSLLQGLSASPHVEIVTTDDDSRPGFMLYLIGLAFGLIWMLAALTFGMSIAQSIVEEKETRIVEILLSAIPARALLTGKILGNSIAALVQVGLIAGVALLGMAINGNMLPVGDLVAPILWFVALFIVGFVMVASLYAAAATLVSRQEDLQNVQQPLIWLIMLPYFLVIFFFNNPLALTIMSYVPFSAPVAMPLRVYGNQAAWWEPLATLGVLVAFTALIITLAARIYERGLLRTGKARTWKDALKTAA